LLGFGFFVRWLSQLLGGLKPSWGDASALEILKKRYAGGEITKEEFEQIKKDLLTRGEDREEEAF